MINHLLFCLNPCNCQIIAMVVRFVQAKAKSVLSLLGNVVLEWLFVSPVGEINLSSCMMFVANHCRARYIRATCLQARLSMQSNNLHFQLIIKITYHENVLLLKYSAKALDKFID